jgi:hypothetical protein
LIDPGKLWQNGIVESFKGKLPYSSLGYPASATFAARIREQDAAAYSAMGRIAAVVSSRKGKGWQKTDLSSQVKRGPKSGRSRSTKPF